MQIPTVWTNNKMKVFLCILAAVLLLGAGIGAGVLLSRASDETGLLAVDPSAQDWEKPLEDQSGGKEGMKIPGYQELIIAADSLNAQIPLINPEGNRCYFMYELVIDGQEEPLYTSKLIEPGKAVTDLSLTRSLSAGEYSATLKVIPYAMDRKTKLNSANIYTTLLVQA